MEAITIRACQSLAEYDKITELEQRIWGCAEREATPAHIALIAAKTGGQVFGAFAEEEMIGFSLAFVARHESEVFLHSHLTGVVAEWQNAGVGRQLKLAQRDDALARGFDVMEWTFDPFAARNAWFNVMKLGAVIRQFIPNLYGVTTSALHGGLPTDRVVAEWRMAAPRVKAVLAGSPSQASTECERIVVPLAWQALAQLDRAQALALQAQIRREFEMRFAAGYVVMALEKNESAMAYLLDKEPHHEQAHGVQALA